MDDSFPRAVFARLQTPPPTNVKIPKGTEISVTSYLCNSNLQADNSLMCHRRTFAPVAIFIFRRPHHARRTILSLQACEEFAHSPIYVFADGPRDPADISRVESTRSVARGLLGARATYFESDTNKGLATSIIEGVTILCAEYGRVIVVEDDLVVSTRFLAYLNSGLNQFENCHRVMHISAHIQNVAALSSCDEAQFLPLVDSWGWATWQRAWKHFDEEARGWEQLLAVRHQRRKFDLNGNYPFSRMLKRQMSGQLDSWAIRWYYAVYIHHGLALFPPETLVHNTGLDGSGTHSSRRSTVTRDMADSPDGRDFYLPDTVEISPYARKVYTTMRNALFVMRLMKGLNAISRGRGTVRST